MADFILLTGDTVKFHKLFGTATVTVRPGTLRGSAKATLDDKKVCVVGDEKSVQVLSCPYTAGPYSIPGMGTLRIQALATDQKAQKYKMANQPVLLQGTQFDAVFEVMEPAKQPSPSSAPDNIVQYMGQGYFMTSNTKWTAE